MDVKLTEELVLLKIDAKDREDALTQVANNLYAQGCVKETYKDAVIARERVFATGLPTVGGGVAIPHTDVEHVNEAAISVARLSEPVEFVVMGDDTETVQVDLIFMLAMKEAHSQIDLLMKVMQILQDADALTTIKEAKTASELREFVCQKLA